MPRVGDAYVEINGDYRDIADNGARKIQEAFKDVAGDLDLDVMADKFGEAGEEAGEAFTRDSLGKLRNSKGRFAKGGEDAGQSVAKGVKRGVDKETKKDGGGKGGILGRIFGGLDDKFGGLADGFTGKLKKVFDPKKLLGGLTVGIVDLLSKTVTFGGLAGIVFQATSALISFSGVLATLPGILATVGLAGGAAAIAFMGIGDAIGAVASGDMKKIDAALKGLAPSARAFVLEFRGIIPVLKDIRQQVQQNFFEQFKGGVTEVVKNLGGTFGQGLSELATGLGAVVNTALNKLSSPKARKFFDKLFDSANNFVTDVGPPLLRTLGSFAKIIEASLPFVDQLFEGLGGGLDKFAEFIDEKVADGTFQEFLTNAFETAKLLGDAIREVTGLLKAMFSDSNETGNEFLESFTKAIKDLKEYFESEPGKEALETLVFLGKALSLLILATVRATLSWLSAVNKVWQAIKNVYQTFKAAFGLYKEIVGAGSSVANAFRAGARALPGFAVGGIVTRPTIAQIGEAGAEAIVPLTNPKRARQVMEDAGLLSLAAGMGASGETTVIVYLGTEQVTDILDTRVEKGLARSARAIDRGDRQD